MNRTNGLLLACSVVLVVAGCIGWARTREYIPARGKRVALVDGWSVEPEIYAYKDVAGANQEWWKFRHSFTFDRAFPRGKQYRDTVSVVCVDTIQIILLGMDSVFVLPLYSGPFWVSSAYEKNLSYAVEYSPSTTERSTEYPIGLDTVVLRMRVLVYPGVHHYDSTRGDSLTIDRTRLLRDTVIEARLRFHESKSPAVMYGD
jgi:hypothetical protein